VTSADLAAAGLPLRPRPSSLARSPTNNGHLAALWPAGHPAIARRCRTTASTRRQARGHRGRVRGSTAPAAGYAGRSADAYWRRLNGAMPGLRCSLLRGCESPRQEVLLLEVRSPGRSSCLLRDLCSPEHGRNMRRYDELQRNRNHSSPLLESSDLFDLRIRGFEKVVQCILPTHCTSRALQGDLSL